MSSFRMLAAAALVIGGTAGVEAQEFPASIVCQGDTVRLTAGGLARTLRVSEGNVYTEALSIEETALLADAAGEVSFRIHRADPNRNPLELHTGGGETVNVAATEANGTDALRLETREEGEDAREVAWLDARTFKGRTWGDCFRHATVARFRPAAGTERLVVRARAAEDPVLGGVTVNLFYEVYDGYPVIRKWVEIRNNGVHWLKLDELVIDDIQLAPAFANRTLLTPAERGAGASVLAYSRKDRTRGVILASEVPSALRLITDGGASGYHRDHFEWVLGPAESFVSEPVFLYGFHGEVVKTRSAESLPLDRAVEGNFRRFLKTHLGIAPGHTAIPAPQWGTWSNFGPEVTDAIVREQAAIAARCGFVLFELDDGWQRDRLGRDPHLARFPDFPATCDYVRSLGLRLGLWVSSYRSRDADDFKALPGAASAPEVRRLGGVAMSFAGPWRHYYANDLLDLHDRYGATYFKQDFTNIKFGDLTAGHDSRTRKESLLRGLRGLLEAQATIRRLAPLVLNEITHEIYWGTPGVPCDLAALKSAAIYHIPPNDYSGCGHTKQRVGATPEWERYSTENMRQGLIEGCFNARKRFYAHRGLPLECIEYYGAATVNWKGSLTPEVQDRQVCSWLMGAPLLYAGDLASLSEENVARYRQRFDLLKRLEAEYGIYRHFQYSGAPPPTDTDWHWWGKLNTDGHGAVVVLRGAGGEPRQAVNIPWVDTNRTYRVSALLRQQALGSFSGSQLRDGALSLELPPLGQEILELSP